MTQCASNRRLCHIGTSGLTCSPPASETNQLTKMAAAADFVAFVITFSVPSELSFILHFEGLPRVASRRADPSLTIMR